MNEHMTIDRITAFTYLNHRLHIADEMISICHDNIAYDNIMMEICSGLKLMRYTCLITDDEYNTIWDDYRHGKMHFEN